MRLRIRDRGMVHGVHYNDLKQGDVFVFEGGPEGLRMKLTSGYVCLADGSVGADSTGLAQARCRHVKARIDYEVLR